MSAALHIEDDYHSTQTQTSLNLRLLMLVLRWRQCATWTSMKRRYNHNIKDTRYILAGYERCTCHTVHLKCQILDIFTKFTQLYLRFWKHLYQVFPALTVFVMFTISLSCWAGTGSDISRGKQFMLPCQPYTNGKCQKASELLLPQLFFFLH